MQNTEKILVDAKAILPNYETYQRLEKQEIPKLESDMKVAGEKVKESNQELDRVYAPLIWLSLASCSYCQVEDGDKGIRKFKATRPRYCSLH